MSIALICYHFKINYYLLKSNIVNNYYYNIIVNSIVIELKGLGKCYGTGHCDKKTIPTVYLAIMLLLSNRILRVNNENVKYSVSGHCCHFSWTSSLHFSI